MDIRSDFIFRELVEDRGYNEDLLYDRVVEMALESDGHRALREIKAGVFPDLVGHSRQDTDEPVVEKPRKKKADMTKEVEGRVEDAAVPVEIVEEGDR